MIFIRSNAPTDTFEGELSGGAGNYDSNNLGLVLSGPLREQLDARLAVQQQNSDGYVENDQLRVDDTNNFDEFTSRAQLRWTPTDTAQYDFSTIYFDADNGYDTWSLDNSRTTFSDQPGKDNQQMQAFTGTGNWLLDATHSLDASLSYLDADLRQSYDADWVSEDFCVTYLCSSGTDTASEIFDRKRDRVIADLRFLGGGDNTASGSSHYVVGLYANRASENFDYQHPSLWYGDVSSSSDV